MKRHIPNALTLCNLICGCIGCIFAVEGCPQVTLLTVVLSGVFDFLDGFVARLIGAYSDIGKELDSLADVVSFGMAPSLSLFSTYCITPHSLPWLGYSALLIAAFSALRLAKFNLDKRQTESFIGMPTPACALLVIPLCTYATGTDGFISHVVASLWFIPVISILLSFLLVSEIPMLSMKKSSPALKLFAAGSAILTVTGFTLASGKGFVNGASLSMTLIFTYYIILNSICSFKNHNNEIH